MMLINAGKIRLLPYYQMPKDWIVHVIDRSTNEQELEVKRKVDFHRRTMFF